MANIYIGCIEEVALGTAPLKLSVWLRYIDETFHTLAIPGICANTAGTCELNNTFDPIHNRKRN